MKEYLIIITNNKNINQDVYGIRNYISIFSC